MRRHPGLTLPEILVVLTFIAIVVTTTFMLFTQSSKIYARTSVHVEPQASLMLALKRVESTLREAMFIRMGSSATAVEVSLPRRGSDGRILLQFVEIDPDTHKKALVRLEGKHVCFFLGRKDPLVANRAIPDAVNGNTIFMVTSGTDTTAGTDIVNSLGGLATAYTNARVMVSGVKAVPMIPDPANPGQDKATTIFAYASNGVDTSSFADGLSAQIVRVTLTVPVTIGGETQNQTLSSQFCLRNFESLN